jgi:hypothetical protein
MLSLSLGYSAKRFHLGFNSGVGDDLLIAFGLAATSTTFAGLEAGCAARSAPKLNVVTVAYFGSGSGLNLGTPATCDAGKLGPSGSMTLLIQMSSPASKVPMTRK